MAILSDTGKYRENLSPGMDVEIFLREDRTGKNPIRGIISEILTSTPFHSHGIMVRLDDGQIGRVQRIVSSNFKKELYLKDEVRDFSNLMENASLNNIEKIQQILLNNKKAYCDDCLSEILSIFPRQQINQICRRLEKEGILERKTGICNSCSKKKIINSSIQSSISSPSGISSIIPSQKSADIDFNTLIGKGETESVEYKSSALWSKSLTEEEIKAPTASRDVKKFGRDASKVIIAKGIAGFLNTNGGHLIIGIKENKTKNPDEIIGIEGEFSKLLDQCTDGYRRMVVDEIIRKYFHSEIYNHFSDYLKISFPEVNGKILCWLQMIKSDVPVFLTIRNEDSFFIRMDAETRQIEGKEMVDYCGKRF